MEKNTQNKWHSMHLVFHTTSWLHKCQYTIQNDVVFFCYSMLTLDRLCQYEFDVDADIYVSLELYITQFWRNPVKYNPLSLCLCLRLRLRLPLSLSLSLSLSLYLYLSLSLSIYLSIYLSISLSRVLKRVHRLYRSWVR